MPFLPQSIWDEEKLRQEQQNNISGQSSNIPTSSNPTGKADNKSGSWVNLKKYLDSNQEGSVDMVEKVTQPTTDKANSISSELDGLQQNKIKQYSDSDFQNEFYKNPIQADQTKYNQIKTGTLPLNLDNDVTGYTQAQSKKNPFQTEIGQLNTEEGRKAQLGEKFKSPNYSAGQKNLDNLLFNSTPAKNKFNEKQSIWQGVLGQFDTTTNRLNNDAAQKQSLNQQMLTPEYEAGQLSAREADVMSRLSQIPQIRNAVYSDMADGVVNDEQTARELGLDVGYQYPQDGYRNVSEFYQGSKGKPNSEYTMKDLMSQSEAQKMGALAQLLGIQKDYTSGRTSSDGIFNQADLAAYIQSILAGGN